MRNPRANRKPARALEAPSPILTPQSEIAPLELPDSYARMYLGRFGIGCCYVICGPHGHPCLIGTAGADLDVALKTARRTWPRDHVPVLAFVVWVFDKRAAQQIVTLAVANDLREAERDGPCLNVTLAEASGGIAAAAERLDFHLTDHASTLARAKGCNAAIEERLAAIQDHGQLKEFHAEYQKRRRAAEAAGLRFPSYNTVRTRLRALLARAADDSRYTADILRQVFEVE